MDLSVAIIGASHAGVTAAEALRRAGFEGAITLFSAEESSLPYHRPPLSKAYLAGQKTAAQIALRGEKFYTDARIDLRAGVRVTGLDADSRSLTLGGRSEGFDRIILATGARARRLPQGESVPEGLHHLRSLTDADRLAARMTAGGRLVIAGGGFIGLEVAATMVRQGIAVTVIEPLPALLRRALPPEISDLLLDRHRAEGVDIRLGATIAQIDQDAGGISAVHLGDGTRLPTRDLLVGIGSTARLELAQGAGLDLHLGGVRVGAHGETSAHGIFAIGDCATQWTPHLGDWLRLESVQAATDQARATALAVLGRAGPSATQTVPWFWSDQYDLKLQMAGLLQPGLTHVLRSDGAGHALFQLRDGALVAAFTINRAADHLQARKLIGSDARLDAGLLSDPAVPVSACVLTAGLADAR